MCLYVTGSPTHCVMPCQMYIDTPDSEFNAKTVNTFAMADSGASEYAFIDPSFARYLNLPFDPLQRPIGITAFDGELARSGDITHRVVIRLDIGGHQEKLPCYVTPLGRYPIILGLPWLRHHDPDFRFAANEMTFDSSYCRRHCLRAPVPPTVSGLTQIPATFPGKPVPQRPLTNASIALVNASAYITASRHKTCEEIGRFSLQDLDLALRRPRNHVSNLSATKPTPTSEELRNMVPTEYHDYLDVFSRQDANTLPPHRVYDHKIPLVPGKEPPFGPLYSMNREELTALREWLDENLEKGFIRQSSSPAASPVLFVKKKDGSLRLCVDYRGLNAITVKTRYPIPLISETLTKLSRAKYFTKFDVISAFNRLRMAEGEEWKTSFRTRFGLFESLVMPFGLCGAPGSFQLFINDRLRTHLDEFVTAYLDDILVFSESLSDHRRHVRWVLEQMRKADLQLDIKKTEFHAVSTEFLGLVVSRDGIHMDSKKVQAVLGWQTPTCVRDVQSFVGFANYYRRFIRDFSRIVAPLHALTGKNTQFSWGPAQQAAFERLKSAFTSAPVLAHFDYDKEITLETDSSDYVSAGVLSQRDDNHVLRPVAFFSKKLSPTECNYEIYDKELLAIIRCFEEWRPELEGTISPVQVITDHKNLEYFMSTKNLNRRQSRWSEFLSRFQFHIVYRPGKLGGSQIPLPDVLKTSLNPATLACPIKAK